MKADSPFRHPHQPVVCGLVTTEALQRGCNCVFILEVDEDLFACVDNCLVCGFLLDHDKQAWIHDSRLGRVCADKCL